MEKHDDDRFCFQDTNSSCKKDSISTSIYITLYIFFSLISALTVFFNLLVIISISTFKHLCTPTNLLILSLAVSDFLVGLIVIPAMTVAIIEPCWVVGEYVCALLMYITSLCTSLSLGNLILISIDRYVAICDPLMYFSKITTTKINFCIATVWYCSIIYNGFLIALSVNVHGPIRCFQECYFVQGFFWSMVVDFAITMVLPCSIIITLYLKIFIVARSQARKVFPTRSSTTLVVKTVQANMSERKATKTLAIVVFNYIICWIPTYFIQYVYLASGSLSAAFIIFLPLMNSFINPIIYALIYPWFKVIAKHIITVKLRGS